MKFANARRPRWLPTKSGGYRSRVNGRMGNVQGSAVREFIESANVFRFVHSIRPHVENSAAHALNEANDIHSHDILFEESVLRKKQAIANRSRSHANKSGLEWLANSLRGRVFGLLFQLPAAASSRERWQSRLC